MVVIQVFLLSSDSRVTHLAFRTLTDSTNKSCGSVAPTDSMETVQNIIRCINKNNNARAVLTNKVVLHSACFHKRCQIMMKHVISAAAVVSWIFHSSK